MTRGFAGRLGLRLVQPFLWEAPPLELAREQLIDFESGRRDGYAVHEYLRWLVAHRPVLLHGTADPDIEVFEPNDQTDWDGRPVRAVFATSDGIWPIFFAVVNRARVRSLRNGCLPGRNGTSYWFSIEADPAHSDSWRDGFVYVLPRDGFTPHPIGSEWTCPHPVRPLTRLPVSPSDFPFLGRVLSHKRSESTVTTILKAVRA
jgi:hypothetical protein